MRHEDEAVSVALGVQGRSSSEVGVVHGVEDGDDHAVIEVVKMILRMVSLHYPHPHILVHLTDRSKVEVVPLKDLV